LADCCARARARAFETGFAGDNEKAGEGAGTATTLLSPPLRNAALLSFDPLGNAALVSPDPLRNAVLVSLDASTA
jgi:hypothetical protein